MTTPSFNLHTRLAKKQWIADLALSSVLLEDEAHYPWLILVPRRANVSKLMDLSKGEQLELIQELDLVQKVLWEEFKPNQLNVAALGNKIPQLHLHVIARFDTDPAWPGTVWDHPVRLKYTEEKKGEIVKKVAERLML